MFIWRTDAEAEAPILWPLMWRTDSLEKTLMLGKIEVEDRGWDGGMASPTQWTWFWVNSWGWQWTGRPGMLQSMGSQRVRHEWLNWAELKFTAFYRYVSPKILKAYFFLIQIFFLGNRIKEKNSIVILKVCNIGTKNQTRRGRKRKIARLFYSWFWNKPQTNQILRNSNQYNIVKLKKMKFKKNKKKKEERIIVKKNKNSKRV